MKNSEDAIGKVLAGLRDAEAPVGMERRILHGLEERVAGRAGSGWRAWLPIWVGAQRSMTTWSRSRRLLSLLLLLPFLCGFGPTSLIESDAARAPIDDVTMQQIQAARPPALKASRAIALLPGVVICA